jgi:hypothetical protein
MSDTGTVDTQSLPFSADKQRAVLGYVVCDEKFYSTVINRLEASWFSDPVAAKVFGASKEWWKRWGRMPTMPELLDSESIGRLDAHTAVQARALAAMAKQSRANYAPEPLLSEMEVWIKARLLQIGLPKAINQFNLQRFDESAGALNKLIADYHDVQFMETGECSFTNYREKILRQEQDAGHALTFGLEMIDRLLSKQPTGGCLLPGHMTVLLASTNSGKTSTLVTTAVANIAQCKSVLFITHEGTEDEIQDKIMRCLTGMTTPELVRAYQDPEKMTIMAAYEEMLRKYLTFVPLNRPGLTVEEVIVVINKFQENKRLATGRGYDLLIDDYPAKLMTEVGAKGNMQLRHIQEIVYNQFVQIGIQQRMAVLVVVQTNREGSKVNRRHGQQKNETRLLTIEDVMESWGIMTAAATVLTLNRTDEDANNNFLTFLVCKSRSSSTGWAVTCKTDYDRCTTHSNTLGAISYRGSMSISHKAVEAFRDFKNGIVPPEKIRFYEKLAS